MSKSKLMESLGLVDTSTPSNSNIDIKVQNIQSDPPILTPQIEIDQSKLEPNILDEKSKIKSKIISNSPYNSGYNNEVKNIFEIANQKNIVTKSMKMYESVTLELEEYCFGIKKRTGKPCFQQDVIANALIEYFKNHPLDEIFD